MITLKKNTKVSILNIDECVHACMDGKSIFIAQRCSSRDGRYNMLY